MQQMPKRVKSFSKQSRLPPYSLSVFPRYTSGSPNGPNFEKPPAPSRSFQFLFCYELPTSKHACQGQHLRDPGRPAFLVDVRERVSSGSFHKWGEPNDYRDYGDPQNQKGIPHFGKPRNQDLPWAISMLR